MAEISSGTAAFDWHLLEHLDQHDPVALGLLACDIDADRAVIKERLESLRHRGLATSYLSGRPTTWGITAEGRACLATNIEADHSSLQ